MSIIVLAHHRVLMHKGGEDKGAAYFAYSVLLQNINLPLI